MDLKKQIERYMDIEIGVVSQIYGQIARLKVHEHERERRERVRESVSVCVCV